MISVQLIVKGKEATFAVLSKTADSVEKLRTEKASVTPLPPTKSRSLDRKQLKRTLNIVVRMLKCTTGGFCQGADGDDSIYFKGLGI